jgi:FtsP/CotA-like multicopper oxidase with cupredoxin domain
MKRRQFIGACALPFLATRTGNLLSAQRLVPAGAAIDLSTGVFRRRFTGFGGETPLWGYNGTTPGPLLRFRRGETVTIDVVNSLPESTTVHWHGVRVPHAMDGVPHITQPPIKSGERFRYQFAVPDSGTYWYHPHHRSFEQVGRGLFGGLIVEEEKPIEVDRDVAWLIADLLLDPASGAHAPFGRMSEHAAEGRLGNLITINGEVSGPDHFMDVRAGERIRMCQPLLPTTDRLLPRMYRTGRPYYWGRVCVPIWSLIARAGRASALALTTQSLGKYLRPLGIATRTRCVRGYVAPLCSLRETNCRYQT